MNFLNLVRLISIQVLMLRLFAIIAFASMSLLGMLPGGSLGFASSAHAITEASGCCAVPQPVATECCEKHCCGSVSCSCDDPEAEETTCHCAGDQPAEVPSIPATPAPRIEISKILAPESSSHNWSILPWSNPPRGNFQPPLTGAAPIFILNRSIRT